MIGYTNEFNSDNIYENVLVQDKKYQVNILKYGTKLKPYFKKCLTVNLQIIVNM